MRRKPLPPIFYIVVVPICIALLLYDIYENSYLYPERQGSHYLINLIFGILVTINLVVVYTLYIREIYKKKKGYVREKVYITHCPHCGYEFKYGVGKYCPNCHRRIWRPYRWVWVKKERSKEENIKYEGGDR